MSFMTVDFHPSLGPFISSLFDQLRTFIPCGQSTFVDRPLSTLKTIQFVPLYPIDFALMTIHFVRPSTFADRSLLVTHGLSTLIGLGIDQNDQNK